MEGGKEGIQVTNWKWKEGKEGRVYFMNQGKGGKRKEGKYQLPVIQDTITPIYF